MHESPANRKGGPAACRCNHQNPESTLIHSARGTSLFVVHSRDAKINTFKMCHDLRMCQLYQRGGYNARSEIILVVAGKTIITFLLAINAGICFTAIWKCFLQGDRAGALYGFTPAMCQFE
jgi:hypothetical protein